MTVILILSPNDVGIVNVNDKNEEIHILRARCSDWKSVGTSCSPQSASKIVQERLTMSLEIEKHLGCYSTPYHIREKQRPSMFQE